MESILLENRNIFQIKYPKKFFDLLSQNLSNSSSLWNFFRRGEFVKLFVFDAKRYVHSRRFVKATGLMEETIEIE